MIDWKLRPVDAWPGERTKFQRSSPFFSAWEKTTRLLERELRHLRAKSIVIQMNIREEDIRLTDGWIKATARPSSPGVILSFESSKGPLRFACDRFVHWGDNVRAIALGLEALRMVDRYAISTGGEQYRGYRAIPSTTKVATVDHACAVVSELTDIPPASVFSLDSDGLNRAYRQAARRAHPDQGGSHDQFALLGEAVAFLRERMKEQTA